MICVHSALHNVRGGVSGPIHQYRVTVLYLVRCRKPLPSEGQAVLVLVTVRSRVSLYDFLVIDNNLYSFGYFLSLQMSSTEEEEECTSDESDCFKDVELQ